MTIYFSSDLDSTFAVIPDFYTINNQAPLEVRWGKFPNQVILLLASPITKNIHLELKIEGILDQYGYPIPTTSYSIKNQKQTSLSFKSLVINEVMAAPKKENPLPYAEYVEIFNPTNETIALGGFFLANAKRKAILPDIDISPGEYLILIHKNDQQALSPYGKTAGLSSWPRYVNGGDKVILRDRDGSPLDSLSYNSGSYGSSSKASAGHSLEISNPYSQCDQSLLLKPSESPLLGTPGQENSVFDPTPDQVSPQLLQAIVKDEIHLLLEFNEPLSPDLSPAEWEFQNNLEAMDASFLLDSYSTVQLTLNRPLEEKTAYRITVRNLRDCAGNLIDPNHNQAAFQVPSEAEAGEIILNEVLFNPRSGTPKFVELYNHSPKYIDLSGWKLANISADGIDNKKLITDQPSLIGPFDYRVVTTDIATLSREYPKGKKENWMEISNLPSYPIAEGAVVLLNPKETLIDQFDYSDKFHHEMIQNTKGISLERLSPDQATNTPKNWHSSSAAEGHATPGYKNSQHFELNEAGTGIQIQPRIFLPEATGEQPFTTISYKMSSVGFIGTIRIFGTDGRLVRTLCENEVWGKAGFYTWNGFDHMGTKVRPGYYLVLTELIHLNGRVIYDKKTVVVGTKL
ncbi:hypothetical protein GCM10028791_01100 [Echinicola sediminis]